MQAEFRIFWLFLRKNFKTFGANRLISCLKQRSKREVRTKRLLWTKWMEQKSGKP